MAYDPDFFLLNEYKDDRDASAPFTTLEQGYVVPYSPHAFAYIYIDPPKSSN